MTPTAGASSSASLHLPLADPSGTAAAGSDDDLGEEDLFGSEDEGNAGVASLPPLSAAPFSASPGIGRASPVATPIPDEKDLFGDDSDGEGDLDEKALFGSDEEGSAQLDEKELFGSEDDVGAARRATTGSQEPGTPNRSERESEMDERDIFGDVSDEEPDRVEDVILKRRPVPGEDRKFITMKLPNIMSVEKQAFNPETISSTTLDGYKEWMNTADVKKKRLLNPENCVRWRFKKGPDGHNTTDEDGRPQYESNSRFVEWEDGSKTLFVGREAFNIMEITDNTFLFEENSQDVHVCHGWSKMRYVATPLSLESKTHNELKRSQFRTFAPNRRSLLMSQEEQDANQALQQLTAEHKQRQLRDEQRQKRTIEQGQELMTAAFLEDDQPGGGTGPSIKDIQEAAKREAKRQRSG